MNLLIQSVAGDVSTDEVIRWVRHLVPHSAIVRLDNEVRIQKIQYRLHCNGASLHCTTSSGVRIDSGNLAARWYRRGGLHTGLRPLPVVNTDERIMARAVAGYISTECRYIEEAIDSLLCRSPHINRYADNATNKLNNLAAAVAAGCSIPDTLVTNEAAILRGFLQEHKRIITKPVAFSDFIADMPAHVMHIGLNTVLLEREEDLPARDTALPALYQQYIDKQYELRIFYLNEILYPMAIFSQANTATRIDFRNYDIDRPNRCVPYCLPRAVATRLIRLMQSLQMNCGSVDMIVTPENDYVFLEVNPVGQFQWLSHNCNYGIERAIAAFLCQTE